MAIKSMTELFVLYKQKCDECDEAKDCLRYALDTVDALEFEIEAIKDRTIKILARLAEFDENLESFPPAATQSDHWIADLWLRLSENESLFGKIEDLWEQNVENPQSALAQLSKLKNWEDLRDNEWVWCCLLEAVIYIQSGLSDEALALLNSALRRCKDHKYTQLRGIAHFFRARIFIMFNKYRTAYWDLCQASGTDGYAGKVDNWIRIVQDNMQNSGISITDPEEQSESKDASHDRDIEKITYEDLVGSASVRTATGRLPFMTTRDEENKTMKPTAETKPQIQKDVTRPDSKGSRNSFDKAIQSLGPAGERLVNSPGNSSPENRKSPNDVDDSSRHDPYRKSVAEQDYYDSLPPDVQAGMLLDEKKSIESVPGLKDQLLDESLVNQSTIGQLPADVQDGLLRAETENTAAGSVGAISGLPSADKENAASEAANRSLGGSDHAHTRK